MLTYQDFLEVGDRDEDKMRFVRKAINQYKGSEMYKMAVIADLYDRKRNPDIANLTKKIYTVTGRAIEDTYSANYKIGRAFFPLFVKQEVQYLLGNGTTWQNDGTADRLGKKNAEFDTRLQDAAHKALVGACSYGFWNLDHIDVFSAIEFVPLFDEDNGALRGGIRYWQIDSGKPFRATLYEEDGVTEYVWDKRTEGTAETHKDGEVLREKRSYVVKSAGADIDADKIYTGENYPTFPIVPLWGNKNHQSEIVGLREQIFVYDAIKSGFCNNVEEASYVYWAISNAPGMDEEALAEFIARVKRVHAAVTEDNGSVATPHQIEVPTTSREQLLERLEKDLFKDAMAFDPEHIASGQTTATQIKAAYNLLSMKTNDFEYCVLQFVNGILNLAGVEDEPTFTRSEDLNVSEEIQSVLSAAQYLDEEYVTRKVMTILGDGDQAEDLIKRRIADEISMIRERNVAEETPDESGEMNEET